jgi:hypothetical protein
MFKTRVFLLLSVVWIFSVTALQIMGSEAYARSVLPEYRLSIAQPQYSGQWKGNDLTVEYKYSRNQGRMDLSGNVEFSYSLIMGYSRLDDFRLGAVLLDENGNVIEEIGLTTDRDAFDPIPFHRQINLPSNAVSIAFSYQGTAIESGGDDSKNTTAFWFSPVY